MTIEQKITIEKIIETCKYREGDGSCWCLPLSGSCEYIINSIKCPQIYEYLHENWRWKLENEVTE